MMTIKVILKWLRCFGSALAIFTLASCSSSYYLISHPSPNQDHRIKSIVLHFTATGNKQSLDILTDPKSNVSAHYVVPDECEQSPCPIYQLVSDTGRAWHAGVSGWGNRVGLNASSIGIEIVNIGYPEDDSISAPQDRTWVQFQSKQVEAVAGLVTDLAKKYQINPVNIVGHSDVAPGRKVDPGALFPWEYLYKHYHIGAWPDQYTVAKWLKDNPPIEAYYWQMALKSYGYPVQMTGVWDKQTFDTLCAFQMHFRQSDISGVPDRESWAILQALIEKYYGAY